MKKLSTILVLFVLIISKGYAQTTCATADCSDGSFFTMTYCITTPTCGGFTGDITATINTTMPNCSGCVEVLLTGTDNPNTRTGNVNISGGVATATFSSIPEGFYVLTAKTPIVPTPPLGSTKTSYVCSKLIQINAVDTMVVNGTANNDPCPVIAPFQGSITGVSVTGGNPAYTFDWADVPGTNNTANRSGLAPGSYTVTVTDSKGCTKSRTFTITEQKPTVSLTATPNPVCPTSFPFNINIAWTATPSGGFLPGRYYWDGSAVGIDNGQASSTISQNVTTYNTYTHSVIFEDVNGCFSNPASVSVPVDSKPTGTISPAVASVCPGQTVTLTGSVISCSSIGATPCVYSFDNGNSFQTAPDADSVFTVNVPMTVTMRIRNATGCLSDPIVANLDTLGKPKVTAIVNPNPICPNNSTNITLNFTCTPVNCAGYQYNFNNTGLVPATPSVSFTSPVVAATTSFPLHVDGPNGCPLDTSITVNVFPNLTSITAPDTVVCANNVGTFGPVTLTATGFTSITAWAPGGQTTTSITVVPTVNTTYTVTGLDANNCPRTASKQVISLAQPVVTTPTPVNHCDGTTSILTASGAVTYEWLDNSFVLQFSGNPFSTTPLVNTTYNVVGTDANGCKDTASVVVNFRPKPTGTAVASPSTICAGNNTSITINVNAPFVAANPGFSYNNGGTYVSTNPLSVGPFASTSTVNTKIQDQFGCISDPIPVTITVLPFTAAVTGASALCSYSTNGGATLTVTGGTPSYEYSIDAAGGPFTVFPTSGVSTALTGVSAGPHTVYVRDNGNACNTSVNFTVITPAPLVLTQTAKTDVRCKGETNGTISVSIAGGTSTYNLYLNTIGTPTISNVPAGSQTYNNLAGGVAGALTYDLIVEDNNGCRDTVLAVPVNEPATALVAPSITPPTFCFGTSTGIFTMSPAATGGWGTYSYTFNGAAIAFNGTRGGLAAGSYPLVVTDLNNCQASTTVTLTSSPELFANVVANQSNCNTGGSIVFSNATGGTPAYQYSLDNVTFNGTRPSDLTGQNVNATVTLYVRDSQGCMDDTTVTVTNIPRGIPIVSVVPPTCPGGNDGSITVDSVHLKTVGGNPYSYVLYNDNVSKTIVGTGGPVNNTVPVTFSSLSGGNHILEMSDAVCSGYAVDSFRVYTSPTTYTVVKVQSVLNAGFARIFVPQPAGFTNTSVALASDVNQATGTAFVYNITGGTPFVQGTKKYYLMSVDNPSSLTQKFLKDTLGNQTFVSFPNLNPGPHTIYLMDANSCRDTIKLEVPGKFFIPNLVTPNGDQDNEYFEVVSLPDFSELRIFNRWGDRVFVSSNYDNKYDFKGLSDGVYYYDLEFDTGARFKGWVQVVR